MTHRPVLTEEILALFQLKSGGRLLDATLGHGGHTAAYLTVASGSTVVGLDADPRALNQAKQNLKQFGDRVTYLHANFANLQDSLTGGGILPPKFSHILFDLGLGSHQLADTRRGFSFQSSGPLSMRYGELRHMPDSHLTAVNHLTERLGHYPDAIELIMGLTPEQLAELIRFYGEERYARRIAAAIKSAPGPLRDAAALAQVIASSTKTGYERGRIHSATRTFQALRLAVNRELEALEVVLPQAVDLLETKGVLAVISFHSLEDRIVKYFFRQHENLEVLTKRPVTASQEEITNNPRARSAKLRAARLITKTPKHDTNLSKHNTSPLRLPARKH
ncbi:MAG: 16S rRNA (cytosine(1402)-N(4))-methyltransferase RsmH [bacterium]